MDRFATRGFSRCLSGAVLALALGACATTATEPGMPSYDYLMALAQASAGAGQTRAALDDYARAAVVDPARKEPWQRIAQLQFDAGRPVLALAAAEETLQRDPTDVVAHEVSIASGLQVAGQTMQRLRVSDAQATTDARPQAQQLAALMGQVFGAESLIPEDIKKRYAKRATEQCKVVPAKRPEAKPIKPRPDPFDVLGGD